MPRTTEKKSEYPNKDFLRQRTVRVVPVETRTFVNQQVEQLPEGFIIEGMSRSLELKRDKTTGEFLPIFDNIQKVITPQFPDEPMTELEFFNRITGYDLSLLRRLKTFGLVGFQKGLITKEKSLFQLNYLKRVLP